MTIVLTTFAQEVKAVKTRKDLIDTKPNFAEAKVDSAADFKKFREEADLQIADNQRKIDVLKSKKTGEDRSNKEKYDKSVLALQQKNNALKMKIKEADNTKTDMWPSFKHEFRNDVDELKRALKNVDSSR